LNGRNSSKIEATGAKSLFVGSGHIKTHFFFPPPNCKFHITSSSTNHALGAAEKMQRLEGREAHKAAKAMAGAYGCRFSQLMRRQ